MLTMHITVLICLPYAVASGSFILLSHTPWLAKAHLYGCKQKLVFNKSKPLTQCPHCHTYIRNNNDSNS